METPSLNDLFEGLAALEAEENQVSAERRRLHQQLDNGFGTDLARDRERGLSLRRRELHLRIDALRGRLGLPTGPVRAFDEPGVERTWSLSSPGSSSLRPGLTDRPLVQDVAMKRDLVWLDVSEAGDDPFGALLFAIAAEGIGGSSTLRGAENASAALRAAPALLAPVPLPEID